MMSICSSLIGRFPSSLPQPSALPWSFRPSGRPFLLKSQPLVFPRALQPVQQEQQLIDYSSVVIETHEEEELPVSPDPSFDGVAAANWGNTLLVHRVAGRRGRKEEMTPSTTGSSFEMGKRFSRRKHISWESSIRVTPRTLSG